jgi:hypothetical protein
MINTALNILRHELNSYLELKYPPDPPKEPLVVLSNVADDDGNWAIPPNAIGVSLINIEEEKVFKEQQTNFRNLAGEYEQYNPEIKINLYMLVSANFVNAPTDVDGTNYGQGLKYLSGIISFFQGKNVFTPDNTPAMSDPLQPQLRKLIVELYSYTFEQQYNFWNVLGAKYLPSVLYKVRLLAFQEKQIQAQNNPITKFTIQTSGIEQTS